DPEKRKPTGLQADMFVVGDMTPKITGSVNAHPSGDNVTVDGSEITFSTEVSLATDVDVDDIFQVGPTQTLVSSERTGIYRRGGTKDGEMVAQYRSSTASARDGLEDRKNPKKSHYVPPWYSVPENLGKAGDNTKRTATVGSFYDNPGFELPATMSGGVLTETQGQDSFATSVTAQRNGATLNLKSFTWQQNWGMTIDDTHRGKGAEAATQPGGPGATEMAGQTTFEKSQNWYHFDTVDAAKAAGWRLLLDNLGAARAKDPASWVNMCEALRQINPAFTVTVKVVKGAETFSKDDIELTATLTKVLVRGMGSFSNGDSGTTQFQLLDVCDPMLIGPGSVINFSVRDVGWVSNDPCTLAYNFPFNPVDELQDMKGKSAKYQIKAKLG
ncbi:MAG TPA: hypothetical protein VL172_12605, partial [Kofleriaceae bacterium]|nr:hypothetical protein [Kofleriaceae bacterium]